MTLPAHELITGEVAAGATRLEMAAITDQGTTRGENQDAVAVGEGTPGTALLVVADGMGGQADGGEAARLAVEAVLAEPPSRDHGSLRRAMRAADAAVAAHRDRRRVLPGTTLVVAVVDDAGATVANLGDSRAYLVRAGAARQVSEDHSWVAEQVRTGRLTPEQADRDPRRNIITRAVTGDGEDPDIFDEAIEPGDVVVICSDGFWGPLADDRIAALLGLHAGAADVVADACAEAIRAGSTDNVTLAVCRVTRHS